MSQVFTNMDGKIRLYDSTATALYLELSFDAGDLDAPMGVPTHEEILKTHRGRVANGVHYIKGADDKVLEPLPISFSCMLLDSTQATYLKDWIDAMNDGCTTTVNSNTLATTKGDTQRISGTNNPAFADSNKACSNVEVLWNTSGTDFGMQYNEVYFPAAECKIKEADDGVVVSLSGQIYGTIEDIASFTAGTDVTT